MPALHFKIELFIIEKSIKKNRLTLGGFHFVLTINRQPKNNVFELPELKGQSQTAARCWI